MIVMTDNSTYNTEIGTLNRKLVSLLIMRLLIIARIGIINKGIV